MNAKLLFVCASGLAVGSADAQQQPELQMLNNSGEVYHAVRATAVTGLTVDGRFVYGKTIELNQNPGQNSGRTAGGTVAYDSIQIADGEGLVCGDVFPHTLGTPGSRYFFGAGYSAQSFSEDIVPASGTEGGIISCIDMLGFRPLCDNGAGTESEVMQQVIASWEVIDNAFMGGFDPDGDGLVSPFDQNDTDGDTFVDEFNGAVIITYANTDTDGDGINDQQLSSGGGFGLYTATGLEALGVPLPSGLDRYNSTNGGTDGPDGGIQYIWTRGDGGDAQGPLLGGFYPATRAVPMFWGTVDMEIAGTQCPYTDATHPGIGAGFSDSIVWGEGEDLCNDPNNAGGAWSENSTDTAVNDAYDPVGDVVDWFGFVPDFMQIGPAIRIKAFAAPTTRDCCDINDDGQCTATDFTAWFNAYNNNLPQCDVNQDGNCAAPDFVAWISAFNNSQSGIPQECNY